MHRAVLLAAALALAATFSPGTALPGEAAAPGEVTIAPQWTKITTVPGVEYAPNLQTDIFRYQGGYYRYDGRWHRGPAWGGPWTVIPEPPPPFYHIEATYFKQVPPGWSRGKKTGWRGGSMPPGQAKKAGPPIVVERTAPPAAVPVIEPSGPPGKGKGKNKGMPPGQMKKLGY